MDLAADYLELKAACSKDGQSLSQDIVDALEMAAEQDFVDVNAEMEERESVAADSVARINSRKDVLRAAYPFELDGRGETIFFTAEQPDLAQTAYLVSLLLSNLRPVSQLLAYFYPYEDDIRMLRQQFQYIATAAIAAEIGGRAWSFGFPRPDHTGFIAKLKEVWAVLRDGTVGADPSAPDAPEDDEADVFACREPRYGLPGFLLIAAQVATGKDWKEKSILANINNRFPKRWFEREPATAMVAYHVIPFARPDEKFRDDILIVGNLLHRLRVPHRVSEAHDLVQNGVAIDAFDQLEKAATWIST